MIRVVCARCGAEIGVLREPKSLKTVLEEVGYKCPRCGASLRGYPVRFRVEASGA